MRTLNQIKHSIANTDATIKELDKLSDLYRPLLPIALKLRKKLQLRKAIQNEFIIELKKSEFKKQFNNNINRIVGLDIKWI